MNPTSQNLRGSTLVVTTTHLPPFQIRHFDNATGKVSYTGLCFEILDVLSKQLGFSFQITEPPDGQWGIETQNGSFNGMIGQVQRGEADIGIGVFTITAQRRKAVDFTYSWWEEPMSYVMRTNPTTTIDKAFRPITRNVYILYFATILVAAAIHWLMTMPWFSKRPTFQSAIQDYFNASFSLLISAMKQPVVHVPTHGSLRIVFATWWLCTFILSVAYAANLVALLSVTLRSLPVDSLEDLSTQTHTKVAMVEGVALIDIMKDSLDPVYRNLYKNIDVYITFDDDLSLWHGESIITPAEITLLREYRAEQKDPCKIAIGSDTFLKSNFGFPVGKSFPFKEEINFKLMQITQSGLLNKWRSKYWKMEPPCPKKTTQARTATLIDTFGALMVLLSGFIVSLLILSIEMYVSSNIKRH